MRSRKDIERVLPDPTGEVLVELLLDIRELLLHRGKSQNPLPVENGKSKMSTEDTLSEPERAPWFGENPQ